MRYLLATAVLALSIAGSSAFALADPSATPARPAAATATAAAAQGDGPGTTVQSPDVAQWTAELVHQQQQAQPVHHTTASHALSRFAGRILARTTSIARNLTHAALRFLGTPYVFGGTSTTGFDCSGFTQHVFAMLGLSIPRTADAQYYAGGRIRGSMRPGDLVFFQTYEPGPSHVGIYIGNGNFVHASSSHGVMVSSLSNSYWAARYLGAKRVIASL